MLSIAAHEGSSILMEVAMDGCDYEATLPFMQFEYKGKRFTVGVERLDEEDEWVDEGRVLRLCYASDIAVAVMGAVDRNEWLDRNSQILREAHQDEQNNTHPDINH